jgi:type VI secretion system protein ImpJ
MTTVRNIPEAIQWHDGMMLTPQHFQQQALRHDQLMLQHVALAHPYHWGVINLLIDRVALVSGIFRVINLDAVMPDGLIVRHAPELGDSLDLDLAPLAGAASEAPVTVHLAVPVAKAGADAAPGDLPRYRSVEGPPVVDETSGDGEVRIPRLRPRLSLIATVGHNQKPPLKFVTLPIAQLVYLNEAFTLNDFVPPSLSVPEQSPLGRLCADIARRAREKASFLIERAGNLSTTQSSHQPLVRETVSEISGLVAGLPQLEALLASNTAHPFTIYLALCAMVGHMAAGASALPPVLSRYDHDDCVVAFSEIRDYAFRMLDRVKDSFVAVPFAFENGKFSLVLQSGWLERKLVIGVRAPASMTDSDVASWIRNSLIASRSKVETLWEMRVMGAARRPIEGDPELDIMRTRQSILFELDNDDQFIVADEPLEIWNADSRATRLRPSEIVLYVKSAT